MKECLKQHLPRKIVTTATHVWQVHHTLDLSSACEQQNLIISVLTNSHEASSRGYIKLDQALLADKQGVSYRIQAISLQNGGIYKTNSLQDKSIPKYSRKCGGNPAKVLYSTQAFFPIQPPNYSQWNSFCTPVGENFWITLEISGFFLVLDFTIFSFGLHSIPFSNYSVGMSHPFHYICRPKIASITNLSSCYGILYPQVDTNLLLSSMSE